VFPVVILKRGPMNTNHKLMVSLIESWQAEDVEQTLALCHADVVFVLNADAETLPYAVEARGKAAVRTLMSEMLAVWERLSYSQALLGTDGDIGRVQTSYKLRHRPSGEILSGTKRSVVQIRDGLVTEIKQHEDAARLAAFLRLVGRDRFGERDDNPPL